MDRIECMHGSAKSCWTSKILQFYDAWSRSLTGFTWVVHSSHAKQCQKIGSHSHSVNCEGKRHTCTYTQSPKPQLDTISCHGGRLMCNSMFSWLQSLLYTHLCVFTKRYPLGEVWFWLKSYSTTSPRFASIPWWSSFVICVVPLFLGQTISQQHKVRWLFGCNYWREHWHWKIFCAGS